MRRLIPPGNSFGTQLVYEGLTLPGGRGIPWLALDMVSSLDGAAAADGQTDALGGAADKVAFGRLRASADAILVGAGTVRAEDYGPAIGDATRRADRASRGLAAQPSLVIVSDRLSLDPDMRVFSDPRHRPIILTNESAPADQVSRLAEVADVRQVGRDAVDLRVGLQRLFQEGVRHIIGEGGPRLNGSLFEHDLVDEMFVTLTPLLAGGDAPRIVVSQQRFMFDFELVSLYEHGHELLLRYRRQRVPAGIF